MQDVITQDAFTEQYDEYLLNGLSSVATYIPLRTNARLGLNVAIRPMVIRANDSVVLFGGKFRVGYTLNADKTPVKSKVTALNPEAAVEQLQNFCKGFAWQKKSPRRFSTIIGVGVAGSVYDGAAVLEKVIEDNLALELLDKIERTYKQYNDGSTFTAKRKAATCLRDAWLLQADNPSIFKPTPDMVKLPQNVVGTASGKVLNQAQDKYYDNVVSFQEKVAELAAQAAEQAQEIAE